VYVPPLPGAAPRGAPGGTNMLKICRVV
jgi:hypothetical protein